MIDIFKIGSFYLAPLIDIDRFIEFQDPNVRPRSFEASLPNVPLEGDGSQYQLTKYPNQILG